MAVFGWDLQHPTLYCLFKSSSVFLVISLWRTTVVQWTYIFSFRQYPKISVEENFWRLIIFCSGCKIISQIFFLWISIIPFCIRGCITNSNRGFVGLHFLYKIIQCNFWRPTCTVETTFYALIYSMYVYMYRYCIMYDTHNARYAVERLRTRKVEYMCKKNQKISL